MTGPGGHDLARDIHDFAEDWLYDGDRDEPRPCYGPLHDLADRVAAEVRPSRRRERTATEGYERLRKERLSAFGMEAWFGAWECGCSDTERSPVGIPRVLPGPWAEAHQQLRRGPTKVQLNHSGVSGYGFHAGPSSPGNDTTEGDG